MPHWKRCWQTSSVLSIMYRILNGRSRGCLLGGSLALESGLIPSLRSGVNWALDGGGGKLLIKLQAIHEICALKGS